LPEKTLSSENLLYLLAVLKQFWLITKIYTGRTFEFRTLCPNKKLKLNFKMTACHLPVIPLKYTGVPITQPEKIILMYKTFFLIFKKNKNIFVIFIKPFSITILILKKKKNML
jgi:hypothetical protein